MTTPAAQRLPESTYRLQFHAGFTFRDAAAIVPYLAKLGITHVYASPYLKARAGSTHGYDVVDYTDLNPELGSHADYDAFLAALAEHGMGHILDIVPNHMGVATNENVWWNDVLEHGRTSRYAEYFDIAWNKSQRREMQDKVLLPVLGAPYGEVLERGELKLLCENGKFAVQYFDRRFPIDPQTIDGPLDEYNGAPGDPRSFGALGDLLNRQHYRLAYWRTAADEINYRRFFDINDLAAVSMERREVFEASHRLVFELLNSGKIAGLRVDHPDGLYDPKQYFDRLQEHAAPERQPVYVVAEKILAPDESLPDDWAANGTTGYDFLNIVNGLFIDAAAEGAFTTIYHEFIGREIDYQRLVYESKKRILEQSLASELDLLATQLDRLAQQDRHARVFRFRLLLEALREVIACFPVYRTYISSRDVHDTDVAHIDTAVRGATERNPRMDGAVFDFIRNTLLLRFGGEQLRDAQLRFAGKFQQLTAPTTAKGVEDTAFYIYNRFISLNEVGGEPSRFGVSIQEAHRYLADRQKRWPYALSALSTHDTKRSEDVRARLNVLSEIPEEWATHVRRWRELNAPHRSGIDPNEEYLLYQTLVGVYPHDGTHDATFVGRIQAYMQKAMREAKVFTSWTDPDEWHERAVAEFIARVLGVSGREFLEDFRMFAREVNDKGLLNTLAQTMLKLAAAGVPDTYQGTEGNDYSLVDPDNRRPVNYADRRQSMEWLGAQQPEIQFRMLDKLRLTSLVLRCRRDNPGLFSAGEYLPLLASGPGAENLFAFARHQHHRTAIAVIPRFWMQVGPNSWRATRFNLPHELAGRSYRNVLTDETVEVGSSLEIPTALGQFPVALLLA